VYEWLRLSESLHSSLVMIEKVGGGALLVSS